MRYRDLRDFISQLEAQQELKRVSIPVDPYLEVTEICHRVLHQAGPAILFEQMRGHTIPLLANLFGTPRRVALGMGRERVEDLRELGKLLAFLSAPTPPESIKEAYQQLPIFKQILNFRPKIRSSAVCQEIVLEGTAVDLSQFPIQTCWPQDAGPLITWGLTVTQGPHQKRQNLGIYRQQVIGKNKVIMRWLAHRGGALDYLEFQKQYPAQPFPIAVVLGCDPATLLAAVTPIPDNLSEYAFAGLLRSHKTELVKCMTHDLHVPAHAEIVLEGYLYPGETALEGPFGDHTGYYNETETFPVFTIHRITHRESPIYHSTYTGRPPDEPSVLGLALNELFIPLLQKQFPEIVDFYLPPEGCSYRFAVVSIRKQYAGHAKRIMMGVWSYLRQFMYTKFVIVVDDDINTRNWQDVIWALSTRMEPGRDTVIIDNTPIDYLDFASARAGIGSKIGFDATNKWPAETDRKWGEAINMDDRTKKRIDDVWDSLGLK